MRAPSGVVTKAWSSQPLPPGSTGTPAAFHLAMEIWDVRHQEAEMIHHRPHRTANRWRRSRALDSKKTATPGNITRSKLPFFL